MPCSLQRVQVTQACVSITTRWPEPVRSRAWWASMQAAPASAPACRAAWGRDACKGGLPGSPVMNIIPPAAHDTMSLAFHSRPGPRSPNGVMEA